MKKESDETQIFYFCQYTNFYYSASSAPWEAAYINCFNELDQQVGRIIFTYEGAVIPPGQENRIDPPNPTTPPVGMVNIYYPLSRYNDVVNLLRYAVNRNYCDCSPGDNLEPHNVKLEPESVFFSVNEEMNIWAVCNNYNMAVGAQYHV